MMDRFKITCGNNNPVHRDQLIRDMIYVGCLPQFSDKNRREVINVSIAWSFSDRYSQNINRSAKYKGCPYWSKNALDILDSKGKFDTKELRHEHIVPRKIFVDAMIVYFGKVRINLQKKKNDEEVKIYLEEVFKELKKAMKKLLIGCVVTTAELKLIDGEGNKLDMPEYAYVLNKKPEDIEAKFFEINDEWARYKDKDKNFKIEVFKLEWLSEKRYWEEDRTKREKIK